MPISRHKYLSQKQVAILTSRQKQPINPDAQASILPNSPRPPRIFREAAAAPGAQRSGRHHIRHTSSVKAEADGDAEEWIAPRRRDHSRTAHSRRGDRAPAPEGSAPAPAGSRQAAAASSRRRRPPGQIRSASRTTAERRTGSPAGSAAPAAIRSSASPEMRWLGRTSPPRCKPAAAGAGRAAPEQNGQKGVEGHGRSILPRTEQTVRRSPRR